MVIFAAMLNVVEFGAQAVLLAPTSVLARQHFINLKSLIPEAEAELLITFL